MQVLIHILELVSCDYVYIFVQNSILLTLPLLLFGFRTKQERRLGITWLCANVFFKRKVRLKILHVMLQSLYFHCISSFC